MGANAVRAILTYSRLNANRTINNRQNGDKSNANLPNRLKIAVYAGGFVFCTIICAPQHYISLASAYIFPLALFNRLRGNDRGKTDC